MAADKLVDSGRLNTQIAATANAIRAKTGGSALLTWDYDGDTGFAAQVAGITTGGRCPRAEQSYTFQMAALMASTMSWTVTAEEQTT